MGELWKLNALLQALRMRIEARWLPIAVNRFADALSRTWNPLDTEATASLLRSARDSYGLTPLCPLPPIGDHPIARRKQLVIQLQEDWGDGVARLYNPPFDLLPLVVRKLELEGGRGVVVAPHWPAQPWFARLERLASAVHAGPTWRLEDGVLAPTSAEPLFSPLRNEHWTMCLAEVGLPNLGGGHSPTLSSPALGPV